MANWLSSAEERRRPPGVSSRYLIWASAVAALAWMLAGNPAPMPSMADWALTAAALVMASALVSSAFSTRHLPVS